MLYKVLNEDGTPYHGGYGAWSLPAKNDDGTWTPGEWMPPIGGELVLCENGYHLCRDGQVLEWLGPALFEAEYRGEVVEGDNKLVVREARLLRQLETWNDRAQRLFACDCAERVLPLFENESPDDKRPRLAIETARRFANGEATQDELRAARAAAGAAARAAAGAAAGAIARNAAGAIARNAAWDAARNAAWAAASAESWDAAWDAARDAGTEPERGRQYARLCEYLDGRV